MKCINKLRKGSAAATKGCSILSRNSAFLLQMKRSSIKLKQSVYQEIFSKDLQVNLCSLLGVSFKEHI